MEGYYQEPTQNTIHFRFNTSSGNVDPRSVLTYVYQALREKGYDPIIQIEGYLLSGDPTYITNHRGARSIICSIERDELIEELLRNYLGGQS
ncbi:MAG: IreB family regulatory phosphoprotein [Clostridia bacterium]|nr:IreB family regulatory phosphoprotein [Clostridia bacterium]